MKEETKRGEKRLTGRRGREIKRGKMDFEDEGKLNGGEKRVRDNFKRYRKGNVEE